MRNSSLSISTMLLLLLLYRFDFVQMQSLFYQNYRNPTHSFNHSLLHFAHQQTITLHPVKDSQFQHRLHNFYLMLRLQESRTRQLNLRSQQSLLSRHLKRSSINELFRSRRISFDERLLSSRRTLDVPEESLLQENSLRGAYVRLLHDIDDTATSENERHSWSQRRQRALTASAAYANELQRSLRPPAYTYAWHAFDGAGRYSSKDALVPRLVVPAHLKLALHLLVDSALQELNRDARHRMRVLDYKSINYGYVLFHPARGFCYVLDLLLNYRAFKQVASAPVGASPSRALSSNSSFSSLPPSLSHANVNEKPRLELGKKMLVRKHAYFVQRFLPLKLISSQPLEGPDSETHSTAQNVNAVSELNSVQPSTSGSSSRDPQIAYPKSPSPTKSSLRSHSDARPAIPFLHLIVPVAGRTTAFHRFLRNFELLVLRPVFDVGDSPKIRVAPLINSSNSHTLVNDDVSNSSSNLDAETKPSSTYSTAELAELSRTGLVVVSVGPPDELRPLHTLMARFPRADLRLVHEPRARNLTRAAMLNLGALAVRVRSYSSSPAAATREGSPQPGFGPEGVHEPAAGTGAEMDPVLVFVDVDIVIDGAALRRFRLHTARGRQAYFPIVLSQHEPDFLSALDRPRTRTNTSTDRHLPGPAAGSTEAPGRAHYWRQFGFGICALYGSDFFSLGTWDERIVGWGLEDIVCLID